MKRALIAVALSIFSFLCHAGPGESLHRLQSDPAFTDLSGIPGVTVDLRYAGTNNFVGVNLYGAYNRAFLHVTAADKLRVAATQLQKIHPGYKLLILDAARPRSVQQKLWERVSGTAMQPYVADPAKGSIHNYGLAVDITIVDNQGKELDMGTAYDAFDTLSQPRHEEDFVKQGKLNQQQLANRHLLRKLMQDAGFIQLPIEWWHYDALPGAAVRKQYPVIE